MIGLHEGYTPYGLLCRDYIHFFTQPDCRRFLPEHYKIKIKQQLRGEERYHIKLLKLYFCFVAIFAVFAPN